MMVVQNFAAGIYFLSTLSYSTSDTLYVLTIKSHFICPILHCYPFIMFSVDWIKSCREEKTNYVWDNCTECNIFKFYARTKLQINAQNSTIVNKYIVSH